MTPKRLINESAKLLKQVMQAGLEVAADEMVAARVREFEQSSVAGELKGLTQVTEKGMNTYRIALKDAFTVIANDALKLAKKELPGVKFKFAEETLKLSVFENADIFDTFPLSLRTRINAQSALMARTHFSDLQKEIDFQYLNSQPYTDSAAIIRGDLNDAASSYIEGPATSSGSVTSAATLVNETRNEVFFEPEVLEQIEAFEFMNGDPVSEICQNLAGTVFEKDDPEAAQFYPPLHFNCKSWLRPLLRVPKGKEIVKLRPSTQAARDSIQFDENHSHCKHC